jgi:hypothetical protein
MCAFISTSFKFQDAGCVFNLQLETGIRGLFF